MLKQLALYLVLWVLGLSILFFVDRISGQSLGETILAFRSIFSSAGIIEAITMIVFACVPIAAAFFSPVIK